ncbi:exonuclease R569, partial [Paramuricea clavata]
MAARFNNRLSSGKFGNIEAKQRRSVEKRMKGIQTWKTQLISSQEKENETSETAKNIAITTRSNTKISNLAFSLQKKKNNKPIGTPRKHDCRKNHSGSSKGMEPTAAVELFNNITKHNAKYATYTGDDDSTTESFLHAQVPYGIEKFSDIIHIKRSLTSRLHNLTSMKKFPNCSTLSTKVIDYLVKCFMVAVNQNKGDPKSMQTSLKCIVPHAFGDHTKCNESWCRWKQDPTLYKHSYLPYGKDLHGEELKNALNDIFCQYHSDTMVEKLSPINNSQRNESFNSTVGSKTPKIRFYGGSDSNDFRVASAVAQTNRLMNFIEKSAKEVEKSTSKNVCSVLVGHNAKRFDVPVLLRNSNSSIITKFQSLSICFADTLTLFEYLVKNSILDLLNHCKPISFNEAYDDNLYLCKRHKLSETFGSLLYDNSCGKSTISKCMVEKIAGSGLSYANLKNIFDKFGRKGLVR